MAAVPGPQRKKQTKVGEEGDKERRRKVPSRKWSEAGGCGTMWGWNDERRVYDE